ncbi:MAG: WD40 repeat domain-containing protein [Actinomycetota bacterium]
MPAAARLATASFDGTATIWDARTGDRTTTLAHPRPLGVAFSPDGTQLATSGDDEVVRVWDVASEREFHAFSGHTNSIFGITYSPDGTRLATASLDGTFKVWNVSTGREEMTIAAHPGGVQDVTFSPDGTRIASSGDDGTARLWDAATGIEILSLVGDPASVTNVAFIGDGTYLMAAGNDRTIGWIRIYTRRTTSSCGSRVSDSREGSPMRNADSTSMWRRVHSPG